MSIQKGIATFTLDYGKCPRWLFERMVKLGREMTRVIVGEYGPDEFVKRIADPVWFQSLGTVLAFDWNASGLTTILTAAIKEAIKDEERNLGLFVCGGKGKTSRKTPEEIQIWGERLSLPMESVGNLQYNSRMAAKVDSALVQDGFQIYHHSFFFSKNGAWSVVQQGMNTENQTARRYHWFSEKVSDLVREPHSGISSQSKTNTLNLTSSKSDKTRELSIEMVQGNYWTLMKDIQILRKHSSGLSQMISVKDKNYPADGEAGRQLTLLNLENKEFRWHPVAAEDFTKSKYLEKILWQVSERKPQSYEKLLSFEGVGPKTMRALSLVSEVIYGAKPSYEDPARYSFAFGGKDATPYPVDRLTYDKAINFFREVVPKMQVSPLDKSKMMDRLI